MILVLDINMFHLALQNLPSFQTNWPYLVFSGHCKSLSPLAASSTRTYWSLLHYTAMHCIIMNCTVLPFTEMHYTVLACTALA